MESVRLYDIQAVKLRSQRIYHLTAGSGLCAQKRFTKMLSLDDYHGTESLVHPLGEVIASLQFSSDLCGIHRLVLGQVLGILPLEELDPILGVGFPAKVAISCRLLVLGFPQRQRLSNCTWATVESNFDNIGDVVRCQVTLLGAVRLDEEGERFRHTDGVRELHKSTLAQSTLDHRFGHLPANIGCRSVHLGGVLARESTSSMGAPSAISVDPC